MLYVYHNTICNPIILYIKIAEELISRGVSVSAVDIYGCHAAHYAALRNNDVLLKLFLGNANKVSNSSLSVCMIMTLIIYAGYPSFLDSDNKFDINMKDGFGRTPFAASIWAIQDRYTFTL